jgi:hypothetical protein
LIKISFVWGVFCAICLAVSRAAACSHARINLRVQTFERFLKHATGKVKHARNPINEMDVALACHLQKAIQQRAFDIIESVFHLKFPDTCQRAIQ